MPVLEEMMKEKEYNSDLKTNPNSRQTVDVQISIFRHYFAFDTLARIWNPLFDKIVSGKFCRPSVIWNLI